MSEAGGGQLPHAEPFQVECNDAVASHMDAASLLVFGGFTDRVVTIHVQKHRNFALQFFRHIKQRGDPHVRQNFQTQLLDVVAGSAFDSVQQLNFAPRLAPILR